MKDPKRSNEPVVWLLFGAGTTVSAIVFPVLILVLGLLLPLGLIDAHSFFASAMTLLTTWWGKLILAVVLVLPVWGSFHRMHHGLHDFKIHLPASGAIFYGLAALFSALAIYVLILVPRIFEATPYSLL